MGRGLDTVLPQMSERMLAVTVKTRASSSRGEPSAFVIALTARQETVAWDPHEVWLNRIKRPRDAFEASHPMAWTRR